MTPQSSTQAGPIVLEPMPYALDALEPHLSSRTLGIHHGNHHAAYVRKANAALEGTDLAGLPMEEIIVASHRRPDLVRVYRNVSQAWNHAFFWKSMRPGGGGPPRGRLRELLDRDFGSYDDFLDEFKGSAVAHFGSGWAWLVLNVDRLGVESTGDADSPLTHGCTPLLTLADTPFCQRSLRRPTAPWVAKRSSSCTVQFRIGTG